jgi:hypothetical protein
MALDFPNNPVDGQVYDNFYYDAVKGTWKSLSSGASPSILVNPTITNPTITNAVITATATTPSTVPITVNGAASQTANLQEWKNSAGINMATVGPTGQVNASSVSAEVIAANAGPQSIQIKPGISDHAYISYFARTASPNTRSAYMGFGTVGGNSFTIANEIANSSIVLSSSYVLIPNQPSVLAFRPAGNNFSQGTGVLPFGSVKHNTGNHYNTSNYRFTAPVSGVYALTIHFNTYGNSGVIVQPSFLINGSSLYGGNRISKNITGDLDVTGAVSVYLNANDYVQPYANLSSSQSFSSSEFWTHFSVHFVG